MPMLPCPYDDLGVKGVHLVNFVIKGSGYM